ncbi:MAG: hypothetical protein COZ06_36265 [Armatimonadetes bacterium CG_4_10_14_3_um_filter_66_18]|nr:hypothetical protein [Armatimonadota bacterium]OIP01532.1 MAG: hypothetical protein AUJ96_17325 [Armatimonadetes bacterium CG2_30_66_41]PIU93797.1 MAG: hypothetical protein COS65_10905 [Armatimonadetes bacterium CG06_land_8_20_14_3_00_66_21]PIX42664.1 MAG: hypothetical protein COZ57_20855 [Armatimonadetes bacterium CG_4_8_14_3_um_filter_66_20]PIY36418.1 MAG: hypothetical protein COZ06_36265 [Armatimonadetes bacterium CG_4_10_14_3_um_filter_66_18]PIZ29806.1 MAG: hypothetical protein COY42_34
MKLQARISCDCPASQQQISRLESPGYEGHSLGALRRVADALNARLRLLFGPVEGSTGLHRAQTAASSAVQPRTAT